MFSGDCRDNKHRTPSCHLQLPHSIEPLFKNQQKYYFSFLMPFTCWSWRAIQRKAISILKEDASVKRLFYASAPRRIGFTVLIPQISWNLSFSLPAPLHVEQLAVGYINVQLQKTCLTHKTIFPGDGVRQGLSKKACFKEKRAAAWGFCCSIIVF